MFQAKNWMIKSKLLLLLLLVLLLVLQIFDGLFTYIGVSTHGIDIEGNPLIKIIIYYLTPLYGLILVKGLAVFLLALAIKEVNRIYSKRLLFFIIFLNSLYLFAVYTWYIILF